MYNIPQEYAARFAPGVRTLLKLAHGQTVYSLASVRLTSPISAGGLTIGAVSAASVEAKVQAVVDLAGETVSVTVQSPDGAASLPLGTFLVSECKPGEQLTTITAYDAAFWALDGAYVPSASSPPATALAVLSDLCAQCSLTLGSTSGLTDVSVSGTLTGYTCREMAGYMAALLGCNVVVDRAGALCLRRFADHGQTVTPDVYYSGALKLDAPSVLAGVRMRKSVTTISTDSDGIQHETTDTATYEAGSGSGVVIEVENPYATQAIVDAVWTALHGAITTFRTGSCAYFGGLTVEPGDLLTITDTDNQSCVFPVMSAVLELDGGCKATVSASGETETALAGVRGPVGRLLSKVEADLGAFKELTADNFAAAVAKVDNLYADSAWVQNLFAQTIDADHLNVGGSSEIGAFKFSEDEFTHLVNALKAVAENVNYRTSTSIASGGMFTEFEDLHYNTEQSTLIRGSGIYREDNLSNVYATMELSIRDRGGGTAQSPVIYRPCLRLLHEDETTTQIVRTFIYSDFAQFGGDVNVTGDLTVTGEVTGSNIPIIQQGNTGRISGVSSVKTTATVTFNTPFPGVPKIMLTPVQNGGYMPTVKLETVSSSGFRLAISIPSGTTNDISVDWLAIYV